MSVSQVHNDSMAPPTKVPDKTTLRRYLERGLTQQQIADQWEKDSGIRVARSAIALAIERYDLHSATTRPDYSELLPWHIRKEHRFLTDPRMLRFESRRRNGMQLTERQAEQLARWKEELEEANAVVRYEWDTDEGWFLVSRDEPGVVTLGPHDLVDRSNAVKGPVVGTKGAARRSNNKGRRFRRIDPEDRTQERAMASRKPRGMNAGLLGGMDF